MRMIGSGMHEWLHSSMDNCGRGFIGVQIRTAHALNCVSSEKSAASNVHLPSLYLKCSRKRFATCLPAAYSLCFLLRSIKHVIVLGYWQCFEHYAASSACQASSRFPAGLLPARSRESFALASLCHCAPVTRTATATPRRFYIYKRSS